MIRTDNKEELQNALSNELSRRHSNVGTVSIPSCNCGGSRMGAYQMKRYSISQDQFEQLDLIAENLREWIKAGYDPRGVMRFALVDLQRLLSCFKAEDVPNALPKN